MPAIDLSNQYILVATRLYDGSADIVSELQRYGAAVIGPTETVDEAMELVAAAEQLTAAVLFIHLDHAQISPLADRLKARGVPFIFATEHERPILPKQHRDIPCCQQPDDPAKLLQLLAQQL